MSHGLIAPHEALAAYANVVWRLGHEASQGLYAGLCRNGPADTVMYRTDVLQRRIQGRRFRLERWGDAYATTGLYRTPDNRRRSNWAGSWTTYADLDTPTPLDVVLKRCDALSLPPTIVIESSPERWHVYFGLDGFLTDVITLQGLNARLVTALDADRSCWKATQLLRPPVGSRAKYGGWTPRLAVYEPERRYDLATVQERLSSQQPANGSWARVDAPSVASNVSAEPVKLADVADELPRWTVDLLKNGCTNRSSGRYKVVLDLKRQGFDLDMITGLILGSPIGNYKSPDLIAKDVANIYDHVQGI